ncbi:beta-N-acetylhexosaminidase [Plesiomonas shigelloides]|uniref:beta-N-acetylhexosaminidase n=1 Tax=Plesiomonas shigelloides TaxID=703 RepID=UPI00387F1A6E
MTSLLLELTLCEHQLPYCTFRARLHNQGTQSLENWQCCFSICRLIKPDSVQPGSISQTGSFCRFNPVAADGAMLSLPAGGSIDFHFAMGTAPLHYQSDGFGDAYLEVLQDDGSLQRLPIQIGHFELGFGRVQPQWQAEPALPSLTPQVGVIPCPLVQHEQDGHFTLNEHTTLSLMTPQADAAVQWLQDEVVARCGLALPLVPATSPERAIWFECDPTLAPAQYQLTIQPQHIRVRAAQREGFIYAVASVLQLLPATPAHAPSGTYCLPCTEIDDQPLHGYRGMMLDCARHFHSVATVKRLINQLAYCKFNYFHWHLTDDEGWRVEINAYPQLTNIGAWRGPQETLLPQYTCLAERHGGYYRQSEIREVIAYAAARGITVIPEIDIPGHCRAAILSLPELLRDPQDRSQYRSIQYYNDNVLSPALEGTYTFIRTVLAEICALFPSPFIHIGADEVPEGVWTASPACQAMMQTLNYHSPKELQGHLLRFAEEILHQHGKRMMGWEEATHGEKVSKDTIIFPWRGEEAGMECIHQGYDVIMQPGQYTYLDMAQSHNPDEPGVDWARSVNLEQAYHYEPLAALPSDSPLRKHILGVQCALWCEQINNQNRMDYMLYPRLLAIAEAVWSAKSRRDWPDFLARLSGLRPLLDRHGINYRLFQV